MELRQGNILTTFALTLHPTGMPHLPRMVDRHSNVTNHLSDFFTFENCHQTNRQPSTTVKISLPQKYWRPRRPLHEALDCPVEYKIPRKIAPETMLAETKPKVANRRSIRGKLSKSCKAVVGIHSPTGAIGATMVRIKLSRRPKPDKKLIRLTAIVNS